MKKALALCAAFLFSGFHGFSQTCIETQIDSAQAAVEVLKTLKPNETDAAPRHCILVSIRVISQLKDEAAVPELIRYLTFHRDAQPEEAKGILIQTRIEGDEYPAILALARIGEPSRSRLLRVIESNQASDIERQNAAHALVLSFLHPEGDDPGRAIRYIRGAESSVNTASKRRLEEGVAYILKTPACARFAGKCEKADRNTSAQ